MDDKLLQKLEISFKKCSGDNNCYSSAQIDKYIEDKLIKVQLLEKVIDLKADDNVISSKVNEPFEIKL